MNEIKQLNVKNAATYRLAANLAEMTGQSLSSVVTAALEEKMERELRKRERVGLADKLLEIGRKYSALPDSGLTEEEILGYDENGLPT